MNNPMVMYGRDGGRGGGGHDRDGRGGRRHDGWGRGWDDWGFFGLPYPYLAPYPVAYPLGVPAAYPVAYPGALPTAQVLVGNSSQGGLISPLGFRSRRIRKHKTRTVVARTQVPYQPMTLFIPREVSKHFEICGVKVGQYELLASRDPIPAELYANEGAGPALIRIPPVLPGQYIFLKVHNHSGHTHRFRASLNGLAF